MAATCPKRQTSAEDIALKLVIFENAGDFLGHCTDWLLQRDDIHNVLHSSAQLIAEGNPAFTGPYWFAAIEDDNGDIVACGNHNLPNGVYLSEVPEDMFGPVYHSIVDAVGVPHRIMAPQGTAKWLADRYLDAGNVSYRFSARWHMYRIDDVAGTGPDVPGKLRPGRRHEKDLVAEWGRAYGEEDPAPLDVSRFLVNKLADGELYVWDDNGAKTLVTLSGRVGNGIRISAVYTPPEHRRRGYASAAVTAVSNAELGNGRDFVVLNVTEGNPAVRIYQRIGYRRIGSRDCFLVDT